MEVCGGGVWGMEGGGGVWRRRMGMEVREVEEAYGGWRWRCVEEAYGGWRWRRMGDGGGATLKW